MRWNEHRMAGECPLIALGHRAAARQQVVQPIKLGEPDCGLDVGDAEIVAHFGITLDHGRRTTVTGKIR